MTLPGNHIEDNWYMGQQAIKIPTLSELKESIEGFGGNFKLQDKEGNDLTIRMGKKGILIVESEG